MSLNRVPNREDLENIADRLNGVVHRTPVLTSETLNRISGATLFFKCENFQKVGAFKFRGASNALLSLSEEERSKGIATHSSGNHGQAVALAARTAGVPAYIVVPESAPEIKKKAIAGYGASITYCAPTLIARETTLEAVVADTGATFVHAYDNFDVIGGQATAAKELIEDSPKLDIIMAPVGGGGLLSGTALATKYYSEGTTVIAAEPSGADDAYRSLKAGKIIPSVNPNTLADGLLTSLGTRNFPILQELVAEILLVNDDEMIAAMRLIWERMKIIVEPSCAIPLAAVLKHPDQFAGKKVGIILSGGNVDLEKLPF
ncbi:MAG: pyridoxal-phosphate dependent enzyme [Salibacteraceae bacterium]